MSPRGWDCSGGRPVGAASAAGRGPIDWVWALDELGNTQQFVTHHRPILWPCDRIPAGAGDGDK